MRISAVLFIVLSFNAVAMRLPPVHEVPLEPIYIDYADRDTPEHVAALIARQSNEMDLRKPEFESLCKQHFGKNFRFSSVVERQEESSTSNIFYNIVGMGTRRITIHASILCLEINDN